MLLVEIPPKPVIVILGPTGVGKTDLSIRLAEKIGGEIVSADSRYFYRGMDIGTAKPSPQERELAPHHLIDVCDPDDTWSLALFQKAARSVIDQIHARNAIPIVVGGTGQYIRAVVEEWELPTQPPDERMRQVLENWGRAIGPEELHARLGRIDPAAAENIEPRNLRRTIRALEVIFHSGRLFSGQRRKLPSPYRRLQIGLFLPRPVLYARIDQRIEGMLENGFQAEVLGLLERGYPLDLPAFSAIGYREMIRVIQGEIDLDEAVLLMKRYTRQYVRRQANWFKMDDPDIHWMEPDDETLDRVIELMKSGPWLE